MTDNTINKKILAQIIQKTDRQIIIEILKRLDQHERKIETLIESHNVQVHDVDDFYRSEN